MDDDELLTVAEAAQRSGLSRATLSSWITQGALPATRRNRRRYVRRADVAQAQAVQHLGEVVPRWQAEPVRIGARLRTLREATGLSQLALAAESGLTHEEVSLLERGQRTPLAATIRHLAQALDVAPEHFIARTPLGLTQLTTTEAAARLGIPVGRLQQWLRRGELPGTKVSGQWRVPAIAVYELGRSGRLRGVSRRLDPRYRG